MVYPGCDVRIFRTFAGWARCVLACAFFLTTPAAFADGSTGSTEARLKALEELVRSQQETIERLEKTVQSQKGNAAVPSLTPVAAAVATAPVGGSDPKPMPVVSKFGATLYGYVKTDVIYDSQTPDNSNLMRYVLKEGSHGQDDDFGITAKESRLGIALTGPEVADWEMTGKLEGDFYGSTSEDTVQPRLRLAYFDLTQDENSFRFGQDWEAFQIVTPRTVNFGILSNQGSLWGRRPQIRYTRTEPLGAGENLIMKAAAARTIGKDIDGAGMDDGADSGSPTFQWNTHYAGTGIGSRPLLLGVSGHYGEESLDRIDASHKDFDSWSIIGSLRLPVWTSVDVITSLWTGENLDNYQGGIGQGINEVRLVGIGDSGGWAQVSWDVTEKVTWNFLYGMDDPDNADLEVGSRSRNTAYATNMYYRIDPAFTVAAEYMYVETEYLDQESPHTNRFQSAFYFHF